MQNEAKRSFRGRTFSRAAVLVLAMASPLALASSQVLADGTPYNQSEINGSVRVGNEALDQVVMRADYSASHVSGTFTPDAADPTTVDYSLAVLVEEGGTRIYAVRPQVISMDEGFDNLFLEGRNVTVTDGSAATADFIIDPGYLEGTVILEGGEVMTFAGISGHYPGSSAAELRSVEGGPDQSGSTAGCIGDEARPCFGTRTNGDRSFFYRIAVPPGEDIQVQARVWLESGAVLLGDPHLVTIAAGETVVHDITVQAPEGSIAGTVEMPGAETVLGHAIQVKGTARKEVTIDADGPYEILGLPDGGYIMKVRSTFGDPNQLNTFAHPGASFSPDRQVEITGGEQVLVDVSTAQAYLEGIVSLSGTALPEDLAGLHFRAAGSSSESLGGATSGFLPDPATGAYRFVASQGDWRAAAILADLERTGALPEDQFGEELNIFFGPAARPSVQVLTGETATYDVDVALGRIITRFSAPGGQTLSNPRLSFRCWQYNGSPEESLHAWGNSDARDQVDVAEAVAGFMAPGGRCVVGAHAEVGGEEEDLCTFKVMVEPGVSKEVSPSQVVGFMRPLGPLVPAGQLARLPRHDFNPNRTLPLRFRILCGADPAWGYDGPPPEIVGLLDEEHGPVDLTAIDLDPGKSNGDTLFFRPGDDGWKYNLKARALTPGSTYTITIRMPDGTDYQGRFALRDKKQPKEKRKRR